MAGQMIMQGFVRFAIPLWFRRVITMIPAMVLIWLGMDPTEMLILNKPIVNVLSIMIAVVILTFNLLLLYQTLSGQLPRFLARIA